jgi:ABC-type cobalamin transport system ATPase subunit
MGKRPLLMLVDQPENVMEIGDEDVIFNHLQFMLQSGATMVFISQNRKMIQLANRCLSLTAGKIFVRDAGEPVP